jgi:Cys-rich repeat protein
MIHASIWALGIAAAVSAVWAGCLGPDEFVNSASCQSDKECEDGDPCTVATCEAHACKYAPVTCGLDASCNSNGKCMPCMNDAQCGESTACASRVCAQGTCQVHMFATSTQVPDPKADDCVHPECDGKGNLIDAPNPLASTCQGGVCDGKGKCVECVTDVTCGGAKPHCFTSSNTCVECLADADCTSGSYCDASKHGCVSCSDGAQNGDETGVDCGGAHCLKCAGEDCTSYTECKSMTCAAGKCM